MASFSTMKSMVSILYSNIFVNLPIPEGNLSDWTIIVSGSNQGLGYEASKHLLRLGVHRLIMAVRNCKKGDSARLQLLKATGREDSSIEVWELDMDSSLSVHKFAQRAATLPRLDALLANAGLATTSFSLVEENERTITVNVVNTFLLIGLLLPKLRESAAKFGITPRISIVNSALHNFVSLQEFDSHNDGGIFAHLNSKESANMAGRYPLSKMLVLFGVRALADRLKESKEPLVIVNSPNPSWCKSELMRENSSTGYRLAQCLLARSTEHGSRALVHGILSGKESNGQYLDNCRVKSPSPLVTTAKGSQVQEAFFHELFEKLEHQSQGISQVL
ncbi:Short-chain dehydrogenase/reductase SDR [Penicillium macrosclerotiorum]|uniref:Short-chain dehydrogenase/reductase SDR n=1 Tax=Penicillium macrosclerotiorum TaxID=303699 RepID=UPI0025480DD3|nr:Short-chain dehydrogenase/reductase SDR [Penicillium macrosclerotiorum]KAJ5691801.1 Short-chain dehydrogenase/reductase SDR [Penicillium macrosclerotiorum]